MIEYLEIEASIAMMIDRIKIWVQDEQLHYSVHALMSSQVKIDDEIGSMSPQEFSDRMENLNISGWLPKYESQDPVLDGEEWSVKYKVEGQKLFRSTGENAWPAEWKKLLFIVKRVTGEIGEIY